jgi:hypothetical protein
MLSSLPNLNPAVRAEAELFTDGALSDVVLVSVATRRGLPVLVAAPVAAVAAVDTAALAAREIAAIQAEVNAARRVFDTARAQLGQANRRFASPPPAAP